MVRLFGGCAVTRGQSIGLPAPGGPTISMVSRQVQRRLSRRGDSPLADGSPIAHGITIGEGPMMEYKERGPSVLSPRKPRRMGRAEVLKMGPGVGERTTAVATGKGENLMPTFSRSLEQSLHRALALANERHHEYATLEHLLLALVDDQDAAAVMRACNVDIDKL